MEDSVTPGEDEDKVRNELVELDVLGQGYISGERPRATASEPLAEDVCAGILAVIRVAKIIQPCEKKLGHGHDDEGAVQIQTGATSFRQGPNVGHKAVLNPATVRLAFLARAADFELSIYHVLLHRVHEVDPDSQGEEELEEVQKDKERGPGVDRELVFAHELAVKAHRAEDRLINWRGPVPVQGPAIFLLVRLRFALRGPLFRNLAPLPAPITGLLAPKCVLIRVGADKEADGSEGRREGTQVDDGADEVHEGMGRHPTLVPPPCGGHPQAKTKVLVLKDRDEEGHQD
mmetsp:Transcript_28539/g.83491  ORF Transcript_28539/g.83491 Transcript_28539/m.83491 type:complete len:289 (+) Transcript_28539:1936-2802(+)